jgi:hypothetical protein
LPRCVAHSKRTGLPCTQWAIRGGTVCRMHGGWAPQVRRKARERIAELRDLSGEKYKLQLERDEVPPGTTMAAVRDYTKTLMEMDHAEVAAESGSAVDDFLAWLKKSDA